MEENEEDEDNYDEIPTSFIIKILYIFHKERKIIPTISKETKNLLNYFNSERKIIKLDNNTNYKNEKKCPKLEDHLTLVWDKLTKSKIDTTKIQSLIGEITDTLEFIKIPDQIFIPILGPSNAGKTTIINGMIGRNILPTDLKECTKRGIIISYCDGGDNAITIYKSNLIEGKNFNKPYYYLNEGKMIGKGIKQVNDLLKGLNYEFTDKEKNCFYYIKTKIRLFDELGLNDSLKRKIYLIDFPGYGTDNHFMEKEICKKIIGISKAIIFVLRNSIIKENKTKQIINNIFNQIKTQKKKIYSGIIKSCAFILNNDNTQTTSEADIELAKKDIKEIIDLETNEVDKNCINLSFFNAQFFCEYRSDYIYFFNLEETIDNEYNNFEEDKNTIFRWPELVKSKIKKNNSFIDFLSNKLNEKLKNKFNINIKKFKTQPIKEDVKYRIKKIYDEYRDLEYINMDDVLKNPDKIEKMFSYGQDKINDLSTLKNSNIENLKKLLNSQFKYTYIYIKDDFKNKIDKILSTLDEFFQIDFSIQKGKGIEDIKNKMDLIKEKLNKILYENLDNIKKLFMVYKKDILQFLNDKKENMEISLKTEKSGNILKKIDEEIEDKLNGIKKDIKKILDDIDNNISNIFEEGNNQIKEFSEGKMELQMPNKFYDYLLSEIGDKNNSSDLMEQLFIEIKCVKKLSKIYDIKGFGNFIKSAFSDYHYIINTIDILLQSFLQKMVYIPFLLNDNLMTYIDGLLHKINKAYDIVSTRFANQQENIWIEIADYYHSIKSEIEKAKNDILNKYE